MSGRRESHPLLSPSDLERRCEHVQTVAQIIQMPSPFEESAWTVPVTVQVVPSAEGVAAGKGPQSPVSPALRIFLPDGQVTAVLIASPDALLTAALVASRVSTSYPLTPAGPCGPGCPCLFQLICVSSDVQCPSRDVLPSDGSISLIVPVAFSLQAVKTPLPSGIVA